jgi:hypothetical protein
MNSEPCAIALKEWGAAVQALREGRQILLLRKGGIHDAGGVFELEHRRFWLMPSAFHQAKPMLKPEHADLLGAPASDRKELRLQVLAEVAQSWQVDESKFEALSKGAHIWNDDYLHLRFGYKPEHPLDCVALRVFEVPEVQIVPGDAKYFGCVSWIEIEPELSTEGARPVLDEAEFGKYLGEWRERLG